MANQTEKTLEWLESQRDEVVDELAHYYLEFEEYFERKLWHELTDNLLRYYDEPASKPTRLSLYNNFIKTFGDKISKLKLVSLGLIAANECEGRHA
jgi:26S proteasome regulatory subunit N9